GVFEPVRNRRLVAVVLVLHLVPAAVDAGGPHVVDHVVHRDATQETGLQAIAGVPGHLHDSAVATDHPRSGGPGIRRAQHGAHRYQQTDSLTHLEHPPVVWLRAPGFTTCDRLQRAAALATATRPRPGARALRTLPWPPPR